MALIEELPVTAAQLLGVAERAFVLEENEVKPHSKPRASSLANCARQQAYYMAGTPIPATDVNEPFSRRMPEDALTAEQGRMFEDLAVRLIDEVETPYGRLAVVNRQIALPEGFFLTGHPDGQLVRIPPNSAEQSHLMGDGLVWGFESKHLGRYGYSGLFKRGGPMGDKLDYLIQTLLYGTALGWDASLWVVTSQDASSVRMDARINLNAKNPAFRWANLPGWHPKMLVYGIDLRKLKLTLLPVAMNRALWLANWKQTSGDPADVQREYDPHIIDKNRIPVVDADGNIEHKEVTVFPCAYCPFLQRCLEDGQSGEPAPQFMWKGS